MALTPKMHFEGSLDESLKAVSNSNLRKQKVIPDGKLVYGVSIDLPPRLPSDTLLFTTDTRELYIGTNNSIKRVNLGNDGEIIDKTDYLTKVEAAGIYIQKEELNPDSVVTKVILKEAIDDLKDKVNDSVAEMDFKADKEDVFNKKEANDLFIDKDEFSNGLNKKVNIENLTPTGNHTFVNNNNNGVSLEYQNIAGDKNSSISVGKDKITINSSSTKGDKIGSKLYINQDGIYYTNSNDDNFENADEILTKRDVSSINQNIESYNTQIQSINASINTLSNTVTEAVKSADKAVSQIESATTIAQTAIDTANGFSDSITKINNDISKYSKDIADAKKEADEAKAAAETNSNTLTTLSNSFNTSIESVNKSIQTLTSTTDDHKTRIEALENGTQSAADIEALTKSIDDVSKVAEKNKEDIAAINTKLTTIETDISNLKQKDIDLEKDYKDKIDALQGQVTTLVNKVSTIQTNTADQIAKLTKDIKDLNDTITELNKEIAELKDTPIVSTPITSIEKPEIFTNGITDVPIGSPVNLPSSVEVTLEDGTKKTIDILYDKMFDNTKVGEIQTITGTLKLPTDGSISNPEDFKLEVSLRVYDYIANIPNNSISKSVEYNTQFNDIADIPMSINCNLHSGRIESFDIDWSEARTNYDPQNSSKQDLTGYIIEKDNIRNINNLNVSLSITVASRKYDITAINADETVHEVEFGTAYSALNLPSSVVATLDDGSTKNILVNWDDSTYSSTAVLIDQTITGTLVLDSNTINTKGLVATYIVKVKEKPIVPKNITNVESLANKTVEYGTTFENLSLPSSVNVTAKNDEETSTISLVVNWNSSDYDLTKVNVNQTITGELVLLENMTNTSNLKATCVVKVKEQVFTIESVESDGDVHEVEYNTPYSSLALPNKVTVTLNDNSTQDLTVTWSNDYSSTKTDDVQTLTGTLTLPNNITNPNDFKVEYMVKVKEKPVKNIVSVEEFSTVKEVEYNTSFTDLGLPSKVSVELNDGTSANLSVTWNSSDYSATKTDVNQTVTGILTLGEDMVNRDNVTATYTVKVKEKPPKNVTNIASFSTKEVDYETAFADLGLPSTVAVTFDDGTTSNLSVTWNSADYSNTKTDADQTITGELTLSEGMVNTDNLTATYTVKVKEAPVPQEGWTEYFALNSFGRDIRNFPTQIGHEFDDRDLMGEYDDDDNLIYAPTIKIYYLGPHKTVFSGDAGTIMKMTEEDVMNPDIMNQKLMDKHPGGLEVPLDYDDTADAQQAFYDEVRSFGWTPAKRVNIEDGKLNFVPPVNESSVYRIVKTAE